ncbi:G5 domain-containing protein [Streptococcus sp. S784/96/1]|uniref:G5 domain-containing protein n=1 Tax=Streptococcus sp. S784/96/1 TaxID=2653499 RepID=UPI00138A041A|nr:G5 domain-containing protein [Streptococcus sp. S784/96/1]
MDKKQMKKFALASVVTLFSTTILTNVGIQNGQFSYKATLVSAEEPPADEDVPDVAETSEIEKAKTKYQEALEIINDPEYTEDDKELVIGVLDEINLEVLKKINKTASRDIVAKIEVLYAQLNGTAPMPQPNPVETTEEIVVREEIQPKERRVPNADILEGNEVRKEGTPGKALVTYKVYKRDGVEYKREEVNRTIETQAVDTVIEYGTKKAPVVLVSEVKVEEPIQYTIREVENPNLEKGQRKVITPGKNGVKTVTYTVRTVDGVETERTKVSEAITTLAVEEVVEVGTKEVTVIPWTPIVTPVVTEETKAEEIPFTKETRENAELPEGETRVIQEGKNGVRTIVYKVTTVDGKEVNRTVSSDTTVPSVAEITEIGTKVAPISEETTETKTEAVAYTSRTVENAELPKGETRVVQAGKDGIRTITYKVVKQDGVEVSREEVSNVITTPAVEEIIEVGTKEVTTTPWTPIVTPTVTEETKTEEVPFAKETRENAELPKGETRVIQEGKNGVRTIVYKVVTVDGKEVGRTIASDTTVPGTTEIIEIGTKEVTTIPTTPIVTPVVKEEIKTEVISFTQETRENAELPKGETRVIQEGKDGVRTIVYTVTTVDGKEVGRTIVSDTTVPAVAEIIEIGTKEVTTIPATPIVTPVVKEETKTEVIAFTQETRENADLAKGEIRVIQEGKNGIRTIVYTVTTVDGVETKRVVKSDTTTEALAKIVEVGTKVNQSSTENQTTFPKAAPVKENKANLPKTGESRSVLAIIGAIVLATVAELIRFRKRER